MRGRSGFGEIVLGAREVWVLDWVLLYCYILVTNYPVESCFLSFLLVLSYTSFHFTPHALSSHLVLSSDRLPHPRWNPHRLLAHPVRRLSALQSML
jgi:hypothetical protein